LYEMQLQLQWQFIAGSKSGRRTRRRRYAAARRRTQKTATAIHRKGRQERQELFYGNRHHCNEPFLKMERPRDAWAARGCSQRIPAAGGGMRSHWRWFAVGVAVFCVILRARVARLRVLRLPLELRGQVW